MPTLIFAFLLGLVASPAWANEGGEEASKAENSACAALAEDAKRDESKLTDATKATYTEQCNAFKAKPLKALNEASDNEEAPSNPTKRAQMPEVQGLDLDEKADTAAQQAGETIATQAERDAKVLAWGRQQELRRAGMTPEELQTDIQQQMRTLGGQARADRLGQLREAEVLINQSGRDAMYANQAAAVSSYQALANKENLTPEEQIGKQTLAAMAGEHAGRTARESGFESEATKQALANDPIFADAFKQGMEKPLDQAGVGGYFGQFQTAEPRLLENHERGECGKPIGNVPALPCGDITSGFGARNITWSPWHNGQDTRAARGAAIMGSAVGRVVDVKYEGPGRVSVHVDHGNDFVSVHRHVAASSALSVGSNVDTNTQIGSVETAGTGPHKHTEIFFEGKALNTNTYNQIAYTDRCTVGCPENIQTPQIAQAERLITSPNQAVRLDDNTNNGTNPTTMYAGGIRGGGESSGEVGGVRTGSFAGGIRTESYGQYIRTAGDQRYTPNQGGIGDGGYADTAPSFTPMTGQPMQGGIQQGSQTLAQNGSLSQPSINPVQLAQNMLAQPENNAPKPLTADECKAQLADKPAADILKRPECVKVLFPDAKPAS